MEVQGSEFERLVLELKNENEIVAFLDLCSKYGFRRYHGGYYAFEELKYKNCVHIMSGGIGSKDFYTKMGYRTVDIVEFSDIIEAKNRTEYIKKECELDSKEEKENNDAPSHKKEPDPVNHPSHYTSHPSGIECIEVTKHYDFPIGNAIKYLWRAGLKGSASETEVQDLKKAIWYIQCKIDMLENEG